MDFPGGRVPFTSVLTMMGGPDTPASPMPCYRTIDSAGVDIPDAVIPFPVGVYGLTLDTTSFWVLFALHPKVPHYTRQIYSDMTERIYVLHMSVETNICPRSSVKGLTSVISL